MSLLSRQPKEEFKIKELETLIYQPYKTINCSEHHLPKQYTCLTPNCSMQAQLICKDCHQQNSTHALISIQKFVPKLAHFLREEWALILKDHKAIQSQWRHCLVNVNYCLDILRQIKSQIEQRSQKVTFSVFNELLEEVYSMFKHDGVNISAESMLKNFAKLNQKYNLIQTDDKAASCAHASDERAHNQRQVKQASQKTKAFSEAALAFSEQLAQIIEQKFKMQKRANRLKQLTQTKIFTLKDLLKQSENLEQVGEVMIDVGKQKKGSQELEVGELLGKCENLKSLRIASKGGFFDKNKWRPILNSMEYLKFLKELILNLQSYDLQPLTELFKEKNKAVRQIERLTLQITDQKQLNIKDVWNFVNTLQLRALNLTLTRDNLAKDQMIYLLKNLRLCTSMSQLPLNLFCLNLSKNKVKEGPQMIQVSNLFNFQASKIKERTLTI